jgi:type I restriction enzyme S subunit
MTALMDEKLPGTWTTSTLGAVAHGFLSGGTPSTKNEAYWQGTVPWITSKWLNSRLYLDSGEKFISDDAVRQSATTVVPRGNLIFATRVGVGKVAVNRVDLAINQDLAGVLIDSSRYDIHFITYQLRSERLQNVVTSHKRGATIQGITRDNLKELEINLPPLSEQRKIAGVLGVVQRAMEQQARLLALTAELKKALLHHLFTAGLRGEAQKQTDLGPVPESWELVTLQNVCSLRSGGTPSKQKPEFWLGSIPWVSPKDMKKPRLSDVMDHISEEALEDESSLAPAGAVFVVIRGMILAKDVPVALAEVPMAFNQDMKAIIPGPRIHPSFLLYALVAFKQRLFEKVGRSAHGTMTLMSSEIAQFAIPLPDKATQQEIASGIETAERKHGQHQRKHAALTALFRTLLHELMTAQLRVHDLDLSELAAQAQET